MPDQIDAFFERMKKSEAGQPVPDFQEFLPQKKKQPVWLYGIAAGISLIAAFLVFQEDDQTIQEIKMVLDTNNSPTVTNTLAQPEEEEFLEWEAPSDYLSNDFN